MIRQKIENKGSLTTRLFFSILLLGGVIFLSSLIIKNFAPSKQTDVSNDLKNAEETPNYKINISDCQGIPWLTYCRDLCLSSKEACREILNGNQSPEKADVLPGCRKVDEYSESYEKTKEACKEFCNIQPDLCKEECRKNSHYFYCSLIPQEWLPKKEEIAVKQKEEVRKSKSGEVAINKELAESQLLAGRLCLEQISMDKPISSTCKKIFLTCKKKKSKEKCEGSSFCEWSTKYHACIHNELAGYFAANKFCSNLEEGSEKVNCVELFKEFLIPVEIMDSKTQSSKPLGKAEKEISQKIDVKSANRETFCTSYPFDKCPSGCYKCLKDNENKPKCFALNQLSFCKTYPVLIEEERTGINKISVSLNTKPPESFKEEIEKIELQEDTCDTSYNDCPFGCYKCWRTYTDNKPKCLAISQLHLCRSDYTYVTWHKPKPLKLPEEFPEEFIEKTLALRVEEVGYNLWHNQQRALSLKDNYRTAQLRPSIEFGVGERCELEVCNTDCRKKGFDFGKCENDTCGCYSYRDFQLVAPIVLPIHRKNSYPIVRQNNQPIAQAAMKPLEVKQNNQPLTQEPQGVQGECTTIACCLQKGYKFIHCANGRCKCSNIGRMPTIAQNAQNAPVTSILVLTSSTTTTTTQTTQCDSASCNEYCYSSGSKGECVNNQCLCSCHRGICTAYCNEKYGGKYKGECIGRSCKCMPEEPPPQPASSTTTTTTAPILPPTPSTTTTTTTQTTQCDPDECSCSGGLVGKCENNHCVCWCDQGTCTTYCERFGYEGKCVGNHTCKCMSDDEGEPPGGPGPGLPDGILAPVVDKRRGGGGR